LDKPIAMACFVDRAPCLPSRMWSISSRTNSPACVLGALPSRLSCSPAAMYAFQAWFLLYVWNGGVALRQAFSVDTESPRAVSAVADPCVGRCRLCACKHGPLASRETRRRVWLGKKRTSDSAEVRELQRSDYCQAHLAMRRNPTERTKHR
jgi:hypothetical protein